jgi:hypothetical protein
MITLTGTVTPDNSSVPATSSGASSSATVSSFAEQLTSAIEQMLGQSKSGSQIEIDVSAAPNQDSGNQQFTVVVRDVSVPISPLTWAAALAGNLPPASSQSAQQPAPPASTSTPPSTPATVPANADIPTSSPTTPDRSAMSEVDAYWAMQPPAVQALRNIPTLAEREVKATELAQEGYVIDGATMVYQFDPLQINQLRQFYGYTWYPSLLQPAIQVVPGVTLPGHPSYDPNNSPPGSVVVSTDFAIGTKDDPALKTAATSTVTS